MTAAAVHDRSVGAVWLWLAASLGLLHAAASVYWGFGGRALIETLGTQMVETFAGLEGLLVVVGLVKAIAALFPTVCNARGWPAARLTRAASWVGAAVLIAWGGANTVVGNLVLSGIVVPDGGYDRAAMIGHAWLWDPLFLAWGVCLVVGLIRTRPRSAADETDGRMGQHEH